MLLLLLSLLSLLLRHPCLPLQPCCNNCHCHGCCLCRYCCCLPHFVDSYLPPQFLLLSATAIATVATTATADPVSATVAAAVCPHCCRHCPCRPCTCLLCCPPALSPSPSPMSLPLHCLPATLIAIALATIPTTLFVTRHLRCNPVLAAVAITVHRCHRHHQRKHSHCRHCQRRHRCLYFHQRLPLLLPLPHHRSRMCLSHHDCNFCHNCCRFLVDCCLTHHCHCSADAFANAATS